MLPRQAALVIVRPFNHTGAGQDRRFVLPSFAAQIAGIEAGRLAPTLLVGNLSVRRDFLHVRDVCSAYIALLGEAAPGFRQIYNITSGRTYVIADLVEKMRARCIRPFEITVDPDRLRPNDIPIAIGDRTRLESAINWTNTITIDEILNELLHYWREKVLRGEL